MSDSPPLNSLQMSLYDLPPPPFLDKDIRYHLAIKPWSFLYHIDLFFVKVNIGLKLIETFLKKKVQEGSNTGFDPFDPLLGHLQPKDDVSPNDGLSQRVSSSKSRFLTPGLFLSP